MESPARRAASSTSSGAGRVGRVAGHGIGDRARHRRAGGQVDDGVGVGAAPRRAASDRGWCPRRARRRRRRGWRVSRWRGRRARRPRPRPAPAAAAEVRADEAGAAGHDDLHVRSLSCATGGDHGPPTTGRPYPAAVRAPATTVAAMPGRIYLSPPDVGARERALLLDAFDSNWIAPLGPHVDVFEREFAAASVRRAAVALSSGTAALHLALLLLGVGPGDDVLVPTLTFVATANAVTYVGARPVFVDCDPDTWNIDPGLVAEDMLDRAPRWARLPAALDRRRPLRPVRRLGPDRRDAARATACPWSRTRPRPWARRTGPAGRLVRCRRACSRSTATRSSPRAAAGCSSSR